MQGHRDDPACSDALDRETLREELRERRRELAPTLVLEPVHSGLDRPFVSDGRAKPGQELETRATAALAARGFHLHATPRAQRLFETANLRPAACAQPAAHRATAPAARWQQKVEDVHGSSVWTRVKVALTAHS